MPASLPASWAAYPTTPYPLRWAWPGTHPTPCDAGGHSRRRPAPDSKPEAEADWLASMGKRFPPAEKK